MTDLPAETTPKAAATVGVNQDKIPFPKAAQQFQTELDLNEPEIPTPRLQRAQPKEKKRLSTTERSNLIRMQLLNRIPRLIRRDPIPFFVANLEQVFDDWVFILVTTSLPTGISSSDPFVLTAFQLRDSAIDDG